VVQPLDDVEVAIFCRPIHRVCSASFGHVSVVVQPLDVYFYTVMMEERRTTTKYSTDDPDEFVSCPFRYDVSSAHHQITNESIPSPTWYTRYGPRMPIQIIRKQKRPVHVVFGVGRHM